MQSLSLWHAEIMQISSRDLARPQNPGKPLSKNG